MTTVRLCCVAVMTAAIVTLSANAQHEPPKPGPEHAILKKMEGTWDATVKMMGKEEKGTAVYKMDMGGLWLTNSFEGTMMGGKFSGRGFDSYDADKKKYVSVWMDSLSTSPMISEGTYDEAKKALTMNGEGPGQDGPKTKHKMVTDMPDANTINFALFMGDVKEPVVSIVYKRKK